MDCMFCEFKGRIAFHLRMSQTCLQQWRKIPYMQMKGSDAVFITKVALVVGQCPVPSCPPEMGGVHQSLPRGCLEWWREEGSKLLGWRGVDESTAAKAMMEKISNVRKNHKKRGKKGDTYQDWQQLRHSQSANTEHRGGGGHDERREEDHGPWTCEWCQSETPLSLHLKGAVSCLKNYRSKYLPYHGGLYVGQVRLAVLDLGLMLDFCINPECTTEWGDLLNHLRGPCGPYYNQEGAAILSSWKESNTVDQMAATFRNRRHYVKSLLEAHQGRLQIYTRAMDEMLRVACSHCQLQGPFQDREDHIMQCIGTVPAENGVLYIWQCGECRSSRKQDVQAQLTRLEEAGSPGQEHDDTLKPIQVDIPGTGPHVVYVPASLIPDHPSVSTILPQSTTVVVPKSPEAVDNIGDQAFLRAEEIKSTLRSLTNFLSKRPSPASLDITLSVLYRKILSDIKEERLKLMKSMSSSKGEITSRPRKEANIVDQKAHWDATQQLCLTNTCSWSEGGRRHLVDESMARSNVSGQVKTRVSLVVLKSIAVDNPPLAKVIKSVFAVNVVPILSLAPIVLRHVQGKMELLRKHVISAIYNNWDLEVNFLRDEWTVLLKGFLYSEEFEDLNKKIARQGATTDDILNAVIANLHIFPTVSLDSQRISDLYGMNIERAQVNLLLALNRSQNFIKYFDIINESFYFLRQ